MVAKAIFYSKRPGRKPGAESIGQPWEPRQWPPILEDVAAGQLLYDLENPQLSTAGRVATRLELVWRLQDLLSWAEGELTAQGMDAELLAGAMLAINQLEERLKPLRDPVYGEEGGRL
jgi:hypothetical protein